VRLWAVKQGDEVAESAPVNRLRVGRLTVEVIELTKIMGQVLTICFESLCVVPKKSSIPHAGIHEMHVVVNLFAEHS